jgi:Relaxase/Mobilisation nuclease domain
MTQGAGSDSRVVDQVLVEWGDALFRRRRHSGDDDGSSSRNRPGPGRVKPRKGAGLRGTEPRMSPAAVRGAVRDAIRPGARQVVIKITGGGKGFKAMAAHARYISRQGKDEVGGSGRTLEVTDELGQKHEGTEAVRQLMEDWRTSGSYIPDDSHRKEAFNIIFSMPKETRPEALEAAVADTAAQLFEGHRYAMVMHRDQGAPHVHVMVRAERSDGHRLNPRKADLDRWRATFARQLQARGIDAVATRQVARLRNRVHPSIWEIKAKGEGRLNRDRGSVKTSPAARKARAEALRAWREVTMALASSPQLDDRKLAVEAVRYLAQRIAESLEAGKAERGVGGRDAESHAKRQRPDPERGR